MAPFNAFDSSPGDQKSSRRIASPFFGALVVVGLRALIVIAVVVVAVAAIVLREDKGMEIGDFEIAEAATQSGFTSVVVSRRIADAIEEIYRSSRTQRMRALRGEVAFDRRLPDVTLPISGVTLEAAADFVRWVFGMRQQRLVGEVTSETRSITPPRKPGEDAPEAVEKTFYRVTLRTTDGRFPPRTTTPHESVDEAIREGILMLVEHYDPYIAASYYFSLGNVDDARRMVLLALAQGDRTNLAWARSLLGLLQSDYIADQVAAIETFERAIRDAPEFLHARTYLAHAYQRAGRLEDAISTAQASLALDPKQVGANALLGDVYLSLHRNEEAVRYFRDALSVEANHGPSVSGLARALQASGRTDEALAIIEEGLRLGQGDIYALHTARSAIYRKAGRYADAAEDVEIALVIDSKRHEAHFERSLVLMGRNNPQLALTHARHAAEASPRDVHLWRNYADIAVGVANWVQAKTAAHHALAIDPHDVSSLTNLARAEFHMGHARAALAPLNQALDLDSRAAEPLADLVRVKRALRDWSGLVETYQRLAQVDLPAADTLVGMAREALVEIERAQGRARAATVAAALASVQPLITVPVTPSNRATTP
ncbi:MAG: tetratricopeptide repeat protein [Alphaproteobacteria bacterium]